MQQLLTEIQTGTLKALIARSPDFYGPYSTTMTSLVNLLLFDKLAQGEPAHWFGNGQLPHSFGYTTDMARALYLLQGDAQAFGQTWHLPTAPEPITWEELVRLAAPHFEARPDLLVIDRLTVESMMSANPMMGEIHEMLYQYEEPYQFDSTKFNQTYGFTPTPYEEGVQRAVQAFKSTQP